MKPASHTELETVIEPNQRLLNVSPGELWRHNYLIRLFVRRNLISQYKQSVLGPLWYILSPLLSTLVFTVVFGRIVGVDTQGVPHIAFYLSGVVLWTFFSQSFQAVSMMFIENIQLFSKVYFPRLAIPLAAVSTKFITFLVQFAVLIAVWAYYLLTSSDLHPNPVLLLIPLLLIQAVLIAFGLGLCVAALTVKYRDLSFAVAFFVQLWMYATPIVYPLALVPENLRGLLALNPVAPLVELFRLGLFGQGEAPWMAWGISWGVTLVLLWLGLVSFSRVERDFVDLV